VRDFASWLRTRILLPHVALLWLLVLGCAAVAGTDGRGTWPLVASATLVLQFRLWDDLEDIPHDRLQAPERTLAGRADVRAFFFALGASIPLLALAFWFAQGGARAGAYLGLVAVFVALYRTMKSGGRERALRSELVLLKYPAFVLLLADEPGAPNTIAAALALYLAIGAYERWERRSEPTR
jgi:4-hydroxybenzoate polyprenyltransferase